MKSNQNIQKTTFFVSIFRFIGQTMLFFWGIYFTQVGFSGWEQGFLFALHPLVSILITIPIGLLNDRISSRTLIQLGFLGTAIMFLGLSFTTSFWLIIPILIIGDIAHVSTTLSLDSLFYKTGNAQKNHQIGIYVGTYLFAAGLGAFTGGFLLNEVPFTLWFQIVGAFCVLIALLAFILPKTETFYFKLAEYKKDLLRPHILVFLAMLFIWALHFGPEVTSYGLFLKENLGLNYIEMGIYMGTTIMIMALWVKFALYLLKRKWPILHILYWGIFLAAIGSFIMTIEDVRISYMGRFIHEAGDAFMMVFLYYGLRKLFKKERAGGVAGLSNFVQMIATMCATFMLAPVGKLYGNEVPILITAGFALLALPLAYRFSHLIKH